MSWRISILDKSPIAENETAADALARTLALAQQAENLGYHRFWIAEHHNTPQLASPSPELLIAWILGQTQRIRVGSGGVMLQHYSPYKVAENFNMLASLAPGRVDLGVGKAPGGLPLSTRALQQGQSCVEKGTFADRLAQLDNWLSLTDAAGEESLRATPIPPRRADGFLLGASQLLFLYNVIQCIRRGAKAGDKPWEGADTLEWTLSSPPPYHSFVTPPIVK